MQVATPSAADQVVVGAAINLFALGLTGTLYRGKFGQSANIIDVPKVPATPILAFMVLSVGAIWFLLYRTKWGLAARSVGEYPKAAEAASRRAVYLDPRSARARREGQVGGREAPVSGTGSEHAGGFNLSAWALNHKPLIGFLINGLLWKRMPKNLGGVIGCIAILASFVVSLGIFFEVKSAGFQPQTKLLQTQRGEANER